MADNYDLVVIGGGPGGYVAAIRAAQLGMKVATVEKRASLGGTCLNIGCIPSKALLESSERFAEAGHDFALHGVKVGSLGLDLGAMMTHKDKVVADNTRGVEFLFRKHKIDWIKGMGRIARARSVEVALSDGGRAELGAKSVVIATGSDSTPLAGVAIDEKRIVSSTGALALAQVPRHLVVVGAGYIGLEMGSVWRRLGAEVTVVEFLDRILPGMDREIGRQFQRLLERQGFKFRLSTKVTAAKSGPEGVELALAPTGGEGSGGGPAAETLTAEVVLVAVGRRPYSDGLGLENLGVARDNRGMIQVDERFETNLAGVYAIGDVIRGPMLAHKAEDEGIAVAEIIAGQKGHVNYEAIPGIVYTHPEVAAVGRSEEELKAAGIAYNVGKFPFSANARARAAATTDGFVKLLADAKSDRVLGCHILGPDAGTLIHEVVVAMEFGASAEDIARTCHGHPTLNEAVKEAALAVGGRAIHI